MKRMNLKNQRDKRNRAIQVPQAQNSSSDRSDETSNKFVREMRNIMRGENSKGRTGEPWK